MGAMRVLGRRCALATDDFFLIGLIDCAVFLPWLAWSPVVYASYLKHRISCTDTLLLDIWIPAANVFFLANWILAALFAIVSSRGTMARPEPRRHVVTLVYVKLLVTLLDSACATLGTYILAQGQFCRVLGVPTFLQAATTFLWAATLVRFIMIILLYDWCGSSGVKDDQPKELFGVPLRKTACKRWHLRLQAWFLWCTTPSEARQHALKSASEMLAVLSCDLDLVASDLLAGLLLYRRICFRKHRDERLAAADDAPITAVESEGVGNVLERFPPDSWPSWMTIQEACHFFDLSMGVYGWPWYVYRNLSMGCCNLLPRLKCCFNRRSDSAKVIGDNCCGCNTAGLLAYTGLPYHDVVTVDFSDRVFEVPFVVFLDHDRQVVLVGIRGTMSVNDMLTDISCDYGYLDSPDNESSCHIGMLTSACEVRKKLQDEQVLERAFQEAPDYRLVFIGHSLGGSVATLLTLMYRHQYPGVRCYAFAAPPSVSVEMMPVARDLVFNLVYGNDIVPSIRFETLHDFLTQAAECIGHCHVPKYKVFLNSEKVIEDNWCTPPGSDEEKQNYGTLSNGSVQQDETDTALPRWQRSQSSEINPKTFVPGRMVHIRRTEKGLRLRVTSTYEFDRLTFRPNMVRHHFPEVMLGALRELGKEPYVLASQLEKHQ